MASYSFMILFNSLSTRVSDWAYKTELQTGHIKAIIIYNRFFIFVFILSPFYVVFYLALLMVLPGSLFVNSFSLITGVPFTKTYRIPSDKWSILTKSECAFTSSGLKIMTSA